MTTHSHPVLSCAEAKTWESRLLPDKETEWAAMQRAGSTVARKILADFREIEGFPDRGRILVFVGKGHNGGDGLLAVQELLRRSPRATADVVFVFGENELRPLAAKAWSELVANDRVRVMRDNNWAEIPYDLCLDAIFGMQFRLPLAENVATLLGRVNSHPRIRFRAAVDLPSGIGEKNASVTFRADFTYATGIVKKPVLAPENAASVGRLRYLDLGFFDQAAAPSKAGSSSAKVADARLGSPPPATERVLTNEVLAPLRELRASQTDKRTFGHVLIVGGSRSYPGAVLLAVRAALRSGVGLVTAFVPKTLAPEYAAAHPEAMWVGCPETARGGLAPGTLKLVKERVARATALVIGPGASAEPGVIKSIQAIVRNTNVPVLLDADALRPEIVTLLKRRVFVCTPHAGEFKRIAAKLFARGKFTAPHGTLVLKGPLTRVVNGKNVYYSPFGGPVLARGGSGDVLAGLTGGLLAQAPNDPLLAACRGVVWHGRAADLLARSRGQVAVEISEILEHLGPALLP